MHAIGPWRDHAVSRRERTVSVSVTTAAAPVSISPAIPIPISIVTPVTISPVLRMAAPAPARALVSVTASAASAVTRSHSPAFHGSQRAARDLEHGRCVHKVSSEMIAGPAACPAITAAAAAPAHEIRYKASHSTKCSTGSALSGWESRYGAV
jgi:hypothetical protein